MHAMAIMAKIKLDETWRVGILMKMAEMAKSRQRAGEFMVIVFVCLVPGFILLTSMHGFVPCE